MLGGLGGEFLCELGGGFGGLVEGGGVLVVEVGGGEFLLLELGLEEGELLLEFIHLQSILLFQLSCLFGRILSDCLA